MQAGSDFEQSGYHRQALREGKASSHQMTRDSISSTGNRRFRGPKARVPDVLKKQQEWSV